MRIRMIAALLVSFCTVTAIHARITPKVIYGVDDRKNVFEETDSLLVELSKSTAAMIEPHRLQSLSNNQFKIKGGTLQNRGICADEKFSQEPVVANCSGFLVGEKWLVTAGHCIENQTDCNNNSWVFDFKKDSENQTEYIVGSESVYSCSKIISRSLDRKDNNDYALIELDRAVTGRRPLSIRKQDSIQMGEPVVVMGHPTGLPLKISGGAFVRDISQNRYFSANLDTFGGNSGSAVFNLNSHEIEGILVRGERDYTYDPVAKCSRVNVCKMNECMGEEVTRITNINELKNLK